jgi:hypothetical protein
VGITVTVRGNIIPQVRATITDRSESAVRDNANAIQALCEVNSPRRTGALSVSWYRHGPGNESNYGLHETAARVLNPLANINPEVQIGTQKTDPDTGKLVNPKAVVASAVEYSLYLEEGTVHMSPHPILRPASLIVERSFIADMSKVADGF